MFNFLPHYLNSDYQLPTEYEYEFGFGDVLWGAFTRHISWTNITYSQAKLDLKDVRFQISDYFSSENENKESHKLKIDFPALKDWEISAEQTVNTWIIPADGPVVLVLKNTDFGITLDFGAHDGFLIPHFYEVSMDFGDSMLYHENWFTSLFMW